MIRIITSDKNYTLPNDGVRLLALCQAIDRKADVEIKDFKQAVDYLNSIGFKCEEVEV